MHTDTDTGDRFQWLGVLGSGLIAAAVVALGMPWAAEAQSPPVRLVQPEKPAAPVAAGGQVRASETQRR